jgi:glycosyltransferase involved in cell wall biosynthesis
MHVGVFLGELRPELGGGYTFVTDVLEGFLGIADRSNHRFSLFCQPAVADRLLSRGLPANVRVVRLASRGRVGRAVATLKHVLPVFGLLWRRPSALERAALAQRVELMWFVGGFFDTLDIPYVATVWDVQHLTHPWFPEVSSRWRWEYRELFLQRHLRRATAVITGTEVGRKELTFFYRLPEDRIHILPHPTPSFALNATSRNDRDIVERFGLPDRFLLYPAQFWAHKNHVNLLLAMKRLEDDNHVVPDLALVGSDKGNRRFVEDEAKKLGLSHKVHFLGFVSTEDLMALYRSAEALIYPSFSGPENLPPLEAFALECPVLASDFPGAREQLGDAALLFDPGDPSDMAKQILRMREEGVRAELVQRGKARSSRWTSREFAEGVLRIVDEIEPKRRAWR